MNVKSNLISNKTIRENIVISNGATFEAGGIIDGDVIVNDGSKLNLLGTMNGNLSISAKSQAIVYGTINCDLIVSQGQLEIFGIVNTSKPVPRNAILRRGCIINGSAY